MTLESAHPPRTGTFHTTRWTSVCAAQSDSDEGRIALADLCEAYYEPVLAYLRCELRDADAAQEMSHSFFAEMLAGGSIRGAQRERGRFRAYLLGALKHFLSRHREAASRLKRGGGQEDVSLENDEAAQLADMRQRSPDAEFDRQWAVTVLARGLDALRLECVEEGRESFFRAACPLLTGDGVHGGQAALAAECGQNIEAFRMAVHRLKKRLRERVKAEIADTLDEPAMVQQELESLFAALSR